MRSIKKINLEFNCPKGLRSITQREGFNHCESCKKKLADFTSMTIEDIKDEIARSTTTPCGKFRRSQLSNKFMMYAAATVMATSAITSQAQE